MHTHINSAYKQMKSSICIETYMYHLVAARETTASLSKQTVVLWVSTCLGHEMSTKQNTNLEVL